MKSLYNCIEFIHIFTQLYPEILYVIMNYWMVKQEPSTYSWDDFVRDKKTAWTGVRNYQARNFLQQMRKGDPVVFYHSGKKAMAVGLAKVSKEAYQDSTTDDARWFAVDLSVDKAFITPVMPAAMKQFPELADLHLFKQSRLSVMPLTKKQFDTINLLSD